MWRFWGNRKPWDTAIADHADLGRAVRSMLSHFGSQMQYGSLRVTSMLVCSKRQKSVSGNTAKNAVVILWPTIPRWD